MNNTISFKNQMNMGPSVNFEMYDGENIKVVMPTKYLQDWMNEAMNKFMDAEIPNEEKHKEIYELAKAILSNNTERKEIDIEYIKRQFNEQDLFLLFNSYKNFVQQYTSNPN